MFTGNEEDIDDPGSPQPSPPNKRKVSTFMSIDLWRIEFYLLGDFLKVNER